MTELKLPKLPDRTTVKITITASADLNRRLHAYADYLNSRSVSWSAGGAERRCLPVFFPSGHSDSVMAGVSSRVSSSCVGVIA